MRLSSLKTTEKHNVRMLKGVVSEIKDSPMQALNTGDVKEPTHFSQRVGHEVPGVVVWSLSVMLVGVGNARHISVSLLEA